MVNLACKQNRLAQAGYLKARLHGKKVRTQYSCLHLPDEMLQGGIFCLQLRVIIDRPQLELLNYWLLGYMRDASQHRSLPVLGA